MKTMSNGYDASQIKAPVLVALLARGLVRTWAGPKDVTGTRDASPSGVSVDVEMSHGLGKLVYVFCRSDVHP